MPPSSGSEHHKAANAVWTCAAGESTVGPSGVARGGLAKGDRMVNTQRFRSLTRHTFVVCTWPGKPRVLRSSAVTPATDRRASTGGDAYATATLRAVPLRSDQPPASVRLAKWRSRRPLGHPQHRDLSAE